MWLRKLSRDGKSACASLALGAVVAAAAVSMGGCNANYIEDSTAPVMLQITSLNGGAQLDSDVRNGEQSTFVCENEIDVETTVINKNPNGPTAASAAVKLESYEVRYTRSDGRGVEGTTYRTGSREPSRRRWASGTRSRSRSRWFADKRRSSLRSTNIQQTTILTVLRR